MTAKKNEPYRNGRAFSCKYTNGMLYEVTAFTDKNAEKGVLEVYRDNKYNKDSPLDNAMVINKNSANTERTMMFSG